MFLDVVIFLLILFLLTGLYLLWATYSDAKKHANRKKTVVNNTTTSQNQTFQAANKKLPWKLRKKLKSRGMQAQSKQQKKLSNSASISDNSYLLNHHSGHSNTSSVPHVNDSCDSSDSYSDSSCDGGSD